MRKLKIVVTITTDKLTQEVVDMLLDGKIEHAGELNDVVVECKSGNTSYMPEGI